MKKLLSVAMVLLAATFASANAKEDSTERLKMSTEVMQQIMSAPDKGVPQEVIDDAKCIVVAPSL